MRPAFSVVLIVILAAIVWQAVQITGSAAAYPIVASVAALLCSAFLLATQARLPRAAEGGGIPAGLRLPPLPALRLIAFGALWIAYALLLPRYGFILTTWVVLALSLLLTGNRSSIGAILGTAAFVLVFAVLIKIVLYVPVPQGWLDQQLDTFLYRLR